MWRYVLKENILRFNALLGQAPNEGERAKLRQLVEQAEAELSELEEASTPDIARTDAALKFFAERAIGEAQKLNGANFGTLQIHDGSRDRLVILAQRNFRAPFLHHLEQMRPGDGSACGRCIAHNAPAAIDDVNSDPEFEPHRKAANEAGFRAVQAFPVRNGSGRLVAVLSSYFSEPQSSAEADLSRMAAFAESLGAELEKYLQREGAGSRRVAGGTRQ